MKQLLLHTLPYQTTFSFKPLHYFTDKEAFEPAKKWQIGDFLTVNLNHTKNKKLF